MSYRDFIQNMSQTPWIKVDKWNNLKNPSNELKRYFCLAFLWIPGKTGRQNWRGPNFLRFDLNNSVISIKQSQNRSYYFFFEKSSLQNLIPSCRFFFFKYSCRIIPFYRIIEFREIYPPTELFHPEQLLNLEKFAILQNYSIL